MKSHQQNDQVSFQPKAIAFVVEEDSGKHWAIMSDGATRKDVSTHEAWRIISRYRVQRISTDAWVILGDQR